MAKNVVHISEAEAARDFSAVLARVRAGVEVVIDGLDPVMVVRVESSPPRLLSESIEFAKSSEVATPEIPRLDADYAREIESVVKNRKPWNPPSWE
jgi:hypothetical protein